MKSIRVIAAASLLAIAGQASAQFVKGNEAVKVLPDGSKRVETPPPPKTGTLPPPCPATKAGCAASGWRMVETQDGIAECTEMYARATTCKQSTYGSEKRARLWIVKTGGQWMQCTYPDIKRNCVSATEFPTSALQ